MEARQILDSLTSHISLFHRSSSLNTTATAAAAAAGGHRSSIIKWFSSLTLDQRQSHLTVVDHTFVQLLLRMQSKLLSNGHAFFFILPDLPSSPTSNLPSLCFRSSHGLLTRTSEDNTSEMLIRDSVRLFGSKEDDYYSNKCFSSTICLDSLTVCRDFVSDVDAFVAALDHVSGGGFLVGDDVGLGEDWVEMRWLKAMGYYSMEAFVANRLEISLRWAWLNRSSNKKGVKKLKEKLKEKAAAAAVGGNVFCRKKGFCDWWTKLDHAIRVGVFQVVFGKAAKNLIDEVVQRSYNPVEGKSLNSGVQMKRKYKFNSYMTHLRAMHILSDDIEFGSATIPTSVSGDHTSFQTIFDRFLVLQNIVSILSSYQYNDFDEEKLFFSTLRSVYTISDCLLRGFRGLLMIVSLECTKLELLRHFEPQQPKSAAISVSSKHRKKGRSRNSKKGNRSAQDCITTKSPTENDLLAAKAANNRDVTHHHLVKENPPVATTARSNRKGRRKNTICKVNCDLKNTDDHETFKVNPHSYTSGGFMTEKLALSSDNLSALESKPDLTATSCLELNPCSLNLVSETVSVNCADNHSDYQFDCSQKNNRHADSSRNQLKKDTDDDHRVIPFKSIPRSRSHSSEIELTDSVNGCEIACFLKNTEYDSNPSRNSAAEFERALREDTSSESGQNNENTMKSVLNWPPVIVVKEKTNSQLRGHESAEILNTRDHKRSVDCLLCDCADIDRVPHMYHQYVNFHHPSTITERLHLDVGRNWHDHFQWSFLSPKISQVEGGGVCVGSQQIPVSLDRPPIVRNVHRVVEPMTCNNYDSGDLTSCKKTPLWRTSCTHGIHIPAGVVEGEHLAHPSTTRKLTGESESLAFTEEEMEMNSAPGMDYSQYFGGGLMYWNSPDQPGIGFSRPPSLSSDDNSFAWHDTDLVRSVDDIVAFSSSYSTTSLMSPTATHICSPFDTSSIGNQGHAYVPPMNELARTTLPSSSSKVQDHFIEEYAPGSLPSLSDDGEAKAGDSLSYPVLRPIIIPSMSAKRSISEFSHSRGHTCSCVPPSWKDRARIKRPPSPVVLSVSHAPCLPPSVSGAGASRRQKGFPMVRSGSSSPRNWGPRGCYQDGADFEGPYSCLDGSEVMWPSWRKRNLSAHTIVQPFPGRALLHDHMITLSPLPCDQDHPDAAFPLQPPEMTKCPTRKALVHSMQNLLHDEIELFCKRVASDNTIRKPYINWAVQRVAKSLQDLWPRSKSNIYGSSATGLSLPTSDVDLVVCLPPVRNLEPIKEAGILEGRNGIKETCLQHAARYLANQDWVKIDSLKTIENTTIPIIILVVDVPCNMITSGTQALENLKCEPNTEVERGMAGAENHLSKKFREERNHSLNQIRIDISFKSQAHKGLQTTEMVRDLIEQFPAAIPLSLVLKQFLADRSLDQSYSGGLSSYCLVLFVIRFLQHRSHHGLFLNQNHGSLLMDFLYFFGNIFDPRRMRISIKGSGLYMTREKGYSIDPLHIDDPLCPTNNVGRNCFRMHQCIKAFSDAFTVLENELACFSPDNEREIKSPYGLLQKIVPSILNS